MSRSRRSPRREESPPEAQAEPKPAVRDADGPSVGPPPGTARQRLIVDIQGAVQGIGFRPFVFRLAEDLGLAGWVANDSRGVRVVVEGDRTALDDFRARLTTEAPRRAVFHRLEAILEPSGGLDRFAIRGSDPGGAKTVVVLPDVAACASCLAEVDDADDRRFGYPFTNCTDCGPRFSIVESIPYDRLNTTMRRFEMCPRCAREYEDPRDRRFHAQPNACPECGPRVELWNRAGKRLQAGRAAIGSATAALAAGRIVAVKGIGGFHLMVDATDPEAVAELRYRKHRDEKPLAVMVRDLDAARATIDVDDEIARLLTSPAAPIVIAERAPGCTVAGGVAPDSPTLGVMLPYTPLHHLLLADLSVPVVATSGNLRDEPISIDNRKALRRLGAIADDFLVHDRPIARHVDDSVVHIVDGAPQPLRRARGLAPMPVRLPSDGPPVLALGGHFKNTVALATGDRAILSQHIGDMETPQAFTAFESVTRDLLEMYEVSPAALACDSHPDYPASRFARALAAGEAGSEAWKQPLAGLPLVEVQHHHAHLAACLAEHRADGPCLGVVWDGTGYGPDGTVWGGEILAGGADGFERRARLRPFRLLGGETAVRQPWRVAVALLWDVLGDETLAQSDLAAIRDHAALLPQVIARMAEAGLRSPWTSSAGRLFDGIASLAGLAQQTAFEGQAALRLELAARGPEGHTPYPIDLDVDPDRDPAIELDWRPLVRAVLADVRAGRPAATISFRFHDALVDAILRATLEIAGSGVGRRVALTGGCFQNRRLTEGARARLNGAGFEVLVHRQVPANDGGLSLGQVAVARAALEEKTVENGSSPCA